LERVKIGEETLKAFKFLLCLQLVYKFNKTALLQKNKQKPPEICGDAVGSRLRGPPCFQLDGDLVGNAPIGSPLLFRHFPKCIHCSVSIAEKASNTLWVFPKESPTLFRYCSNGLQELLDAFPNVPA
jgi:hypothetical protein